MDFNGSLVLGNLNEISLKELWNSKVYNDFRKDIIDDNFKNKKLCIDCEDWYKCW
jgi:MoaA/NifB/PqqE/SkfB family radical SAM enzyme